MTDMYALGAARAREVVEREHSMCMPFGLAAMPNLAGALMAFYGVDPAAHPTVVAELEKAIGEELLDIGREVLTAHGLWIDPTAPAAVTRGGTGHDHDEDTA